MASRWGRDEIEDEARRTGWSVSTAAFDGGRIHRQELIRDRHRIFVLWLCTPWSPEGRWAGAVLFDEAAGAERNVWTLAGANGLVGYLRDTR